MSHLSTVKLGFKCSPCLEQALKKAFDLNAKLVERNLVVDKSQFKSTSISSRYKTDLVFLWDAKTEEYSMQGDMWYFYNIYGPEFLSNLTQEYARQWAHHQADQLGFMVQEVPGDGGNVKFIFSAPAGQISAQLRADGKLDVGVHGVMGPGCQQFSALLQQSIGIVENSVQTQEYYGDPQAIAMMQQQMLGG